jgi:hypothetical protein
MEAFQQPTLKTTFAGQPLCAGFIEQVFVEQTLSIEEW